ncbi:MAG: GNAT family protein [Methyloprofundus sp.]|nr:GNAT family protein [Methyloprofundus sp.]MDT8425207.1 GNAT family protein [Methyloprofundus sp.]
MQELDNKYQNFPLYGRLVLLKPFTKKNITVEYLDWLNNKAAMQHSNQRLCVHNHNSCEQYVDSFVRTDHLFLVIYYKDKMVGTMTAYISAKEQVADLGILVDVQMRGKGIGLDAWSTLMDYLMGQGLSVTAGTTPANQAMIKIAEKSGMQSEGQDYLEEIVNGARMKTLYCLYVSPP